MNGEYDIYLGNSVVGKARTWGEGLYYRFSCRCKLSGAVLCRVILSCDGKETDLGICVPMGTAFGLEKRVAKKEIGQGEVRFSIRPRHNRRDEVFVPISPEEPFVYLSRLENAYLKRQGEIVGVTLQCPDNQKVSSRPTGQ